jgi:hypothetical protein
MPLGMLIPKHPREPKWLFDDLGRLLFFQFESGATKNLQIQRRGLYLSNEPLHDGFGFTVEKLQDFLRFQPCFRYAVSQ